MSNLVVPSSCSKIQLLWLEYIMEKEGITIQHALSPDGEYYIKGVGYVDGYCASTNTVYEFHGSFWHGDPACFNAEAINPVSNKKYGDLYQATILRDAMIKALKYQLVVVWESEIDRKTLLMGYPQLVEKYGKKPIRIASVSRVNQDSTPEVREDREELCTMIRSLSFQQVELDKRARVLREELAGLKKERKTISTEKALLHKKLTSTYIQVEQGVEKDVTLETTHIEEDIIVTIEPSCRQFLTERCEILKGQGRQKINGGDLYQHYLAWYGSKRIDNKALGRNAFYQQMDMILGGRVRYQYIGVRVKQS